MKASQGNVAKRLRCGWDLELSPYLKFTRVRWWKIFKIDQHLAKLLARVECPFWLKGYFYFVLLCIDPTRIQACGKQLLLLRQWS